MAAEVRQDMVEEARKFLSNPKVLSEKEENKRAFLLKKGLTEEEINMALSMVPNNIIVNNSAPSPVLGPPVPYIPQSSRWSQIRDIANLIVIISGASYGVHYIYKFYIGPLLTGQRQKSVEENMIELQHSVVAVLKDVQNTLSTMEQTLSAQTTKIQALNNERTTTADAATKHQFEELKTEITSLKGLLVNKRSFPAPPSLSAGIPSWQLSSVGSSAISSTIVNNTSSQASGGGLVNGSSSSNEPTETTTVTNGLNDHSKITNGHSNSLDTENGVVDDEDDDDDDDESAVTVAAVTNASSITSTNANQTQDTQVTVKTTELESTEQDQMSSHSNDLIKKDMDDTSEKKETVEDTIITDSSDEISQ